MIPHTPPQLIAEAEKMLRVNSPRMAMLYMAKAERLLEEARRERLTPVQRSAEDLSRTFENIRTGLTPIFHEVARQVTTTVEAFRPVLEWFNDLPPEARIAMKEAHSE